MHHGIKIYLQVYRNYNIYIPQCVLHITYYIQYFGYQIWQLFMPTLFFNEINEGYKYSLNQGATHHVSG